MNLDNDLFDVDPQNHRDGFDFKSYLTKYIAKWKLLLLSFVFFLSAAFFYLRYATSKYHINAKLLIQDQKRPGGTSAVGDAMDLSNLLGSVSSVHNEVEVLNTRYIMDRLVRDKHLNIIWYKTGTLNTIELNKPPFEFEVVKLEDSIISTRFLMSIKGGEFEISYTNPYTEKEKLERFPFNKTFGIEGFGIFKISANGRQILAKDDSFEFIISSIDSRVESLRSSMVIEATSNIASSINITFDYPLPIKGERILNGYIQQYIDLDRKDRSRIADSTIKFIDERIILVNDELNSIESNIQNFMQGKGLANLSEQSRILLETSSEYVKRVSEIENRIQIINAVEETINIDGNQRIVSGSILDDDPGFIAMLNSYNSLVLEKERLLLSYRPDNPFVQNVDKQIATVRTNISDYLHNTKNSLIVSKNEINKNSGKLKGSIREVPAQEREFLDLSRQQQLKQELYLFLLQKREETAVANTSSIAGIRVIDPPKAENQPYSPKKNLVFGGAFILALLVPVCSIYVAEILNTKVENRKDIEKRTQAPIVGEFSHNSLETDLIEFKSSRSALAEQFRALRTNLQFMMPKPTDKVILITSGMPGEGKSFTSLNLANIYAVSGKKVLLLEFDLRKPKLSKTYTGLSKVGISNYIVDQNLTLDDMINPVDDTGNLYFGACGPIPPNPAELIMSERVGQMMKEARDRFDIIVIDAPPLGAVTDGQLLSEYADVTLHLVRAGYTPHELVGLPEDMRREGKIKNMAIVLNDVSENAGGYYGYNYGYYHGEDHKKAWWKFGRK